MKHHNEVVLVKKGERTFEQFVNWFDLMPEEWCPVFDADTAKDILTKCNYNPQEHFLYNECGFNKPKETPKPKYKVRDWVRLKSSEGITLRCGEDATNTIWKICYICDGDITISMAIEDCSYHLRIDNLNDIEPYSPREGECYVYEKHSKDVKCVSLSGLCRLSARGDSAIFPSVEFESRGCTLRPATKTERQELIELISRNMNKTYNEETKKWEDMKRKVKKGDYVKCGDDIYIVSDVNDNFFSAEGKEGGDDKIGFQLGVLGKTENVVFATPQEIAEFKRANKVKDKASIGDNIEMKLKDNVIKIKLLSITTQWKDNNGMEITLNATEPISFKFELDEIDYVINFGKDEK